MATASRQVAALAGDGFRSLPHAHRSPVRVLGLAVWGTGVALDAVTTVAMMGTGLFEEANPVAEAGMALAGVGGYTTLVSLVCVLLAVVGSGRPRGLYAWTVSVTLAAVGAAKLATGLSNLLLWAATGG